MQFLTKVERYISKVFFFVNSGWISITLYSSNDCLSSAVSDSGLSSAAVAGIVVVLFAAVALIAGLIYRRRSRYRPAPQNVSITYS